MVGEGPDGREAKCSEDTGDEEDRWGGGAQAVFLACKTDGRHWAGSFNRRWEKTPFILYQTGVVNWDGVTKQSPGLVEPGLEV